MNELKNYPLREQFINKTKDQGIKSALESNRYLFFDPALFLQLINYFKEQDSQCKQEHAVPLKPRHYAEAITLLKTR